MTYLPDVDRPPLYPRPIIGPSTPVGLVLEEEPPGPIEPLLGGIEPPGPIEPRGVLGFIGGNTRPRG